MIVRTLCVFVMVRDKEEEGICFIVIHMNEFYGCSGKLMVREANFID